MSVQGNRARDRELGGGGVGGRDQAAMIPPSLEQAESRKSIAKRRVLGGRRD